MLTEHLVHNPDHPEPSLALETLTKHAELPESLKRLIGLTKVYLKRRGESTDPLDGVVVKSYRGAQTVENVRYVYPLTESKEKIYDQIAAPDGFRIIVVRVGQNIVLARLDDKTALVTTNLHGCTGVGMSVLSDEYGLLALAHLNYHPGRTISEFANRHNITGLVLSIPEGGNRVQNNRRILTAVNRSGKSLEIVEADHYRGTSGMLLTNQGGLIFRQYGYNLRPVKQWSWSSAP